jgi:hypothetical protein
MTRSTFASIFALTLAVLALGGCADEPTGVGAGILPPGDRPVLRQDTLYAVAHTTSRAIVSTRAGRYVMIGDTANYQAWSFLQFASLPDSLYFATITEAHVVLTGRYRFGSPSAPLSFDVYRAVQGWQGDSLTVDSLVQYPSTYYDPSPLASVNPGALADTDKIQIPLADTALVRSWFNAFPDSLNRTYGIILRPTNASVIRGFYSFAELDIALRPALVVQYTLPTSSGTYTAQYGLSRFLATVPTADVLKDTASYVYVQNSIVFRGQLTFDISRLPRSTIVNRAYLEVSLAPSQSLRTGLAPDSLFAVYLNASGSFVPSLIQGSLAYSDSLHRQFYQFQVRDFLQNWLASPSTPRRVALTGYTEDAALDLLVLNGSAAPLGLRPRMRIIYSSTQR